MPLAGALDGLVIADFSRVLAGPYATMLLADLGATVVKVETPIGDETRRWGPPWATDGVSTYYLSVNRNKHSIALDLRTEEGLADAVAIATKADVFVENFRAGSLDRMGLGYEALRAHNPGLVYCSITGFGAASRLPGYDAVAQAVSGLMSVTGPADEPSKVGVAMSDVTTGMHAAIGILAAIRHRDRTGEGQHLRLSLLSSTLSALVNAGNAYTETGESPRSMGNRHPSLCPYQPFETADRPLVIACGNDAQFGALCTCLGVPELAADPRFAHNAYRVAHRDELTGLLGERLAAKGADEWETLLGDASVPCGPVNDIGGGLTLATALGLAPVVQVGSRSQVASPFQLSATPPTYRTPPPDVDEHGDAVRHWLTGGELT
ncbi:MAG: CoA transferase [Streptosporangiales bacterium]|nr:CoA transferase [Streptosporangiales bacterium]